MGLGTSPESAIPRQSLFSAVANKLRDQIIRGEIAEGTQLRQDAIATQYQVSKIPVREALRQLEAEGLVTIVPNRGAVVPALSPDDIEELFSIRSLLEPEVLKRSIPSPYRGRFFAGGSDPENLRKRAPPRRSRFRLGTPELGVSLHAVLQSQPTAFHGDDPEHQQQRRTLHPPAVVLDPWHEAGQ